MDRYQRFAPFYNALSGERPVYGAGRRAGIDLLRLQPGMTVLDLGCGTGLNFPGLRSAVGPGGRIIGLDRSAAMLAQARGLSEATLIQADLTGQLPDLPSVDAVISTYVLSLVPGWRAVWSSAVVPLGPGTRVCVVDMQRPIGLARVLTPLARLACGLGGSDIDAHPWTAVEDGCDDVGRVSLRGGHVQVRAGTLR